MAVRTLVVDSEVSGCCVLIVISFSRQYCRSASLFCVFFFNNIINISEIPLMCGHRHLTQQRQSAKGTDFLPP